MMSSAPVGDSLQTAGERRRGDWALLGGLAFLLFLAHMLVSVRSAFAVVVMIVMLTMHGRLYYPVPAYPMLFAASGVTFERWFGKWASGRWLKPAYLTPILVAGLILAPAAYFSMLGVEQYLAYSRLLHLQPVRIENHRMRPPPQLYADQFGWKEMAQVGRGPVSQTAS